MAPFHYFGVGYGIDLAQLKFSRGRGYDAENSTNVYTADDARVLAVIDAARRQLPDLHTMRAIGFCVSVRHAEFMAERFNKAGLPAMAVSGETSRGERQRRSPGSRTAIRAVFTVDLFNEGVDIPDADTLFFLRPTESATLFLQQLGRVCASGKGSVLPSSTSSDANTRSSGSTFASARSPVGLAAMSSGESPAASPFCLLAAMSRSTW